MRDRIKAVVTTWNDDMLTQSDTRRGTRRGRWLAALSVSAAGVFGIGTLMSQGVLAANIMLSDKPFTLRSNQIKGSGFGAYVNQANSFSGPQTAIRASVAQAEVDGMCGVIEHTVAGQSFYLVIKSGTPLRADGTPTPNIDPSQLIRATNLTMEANELKTTGTGKTRIDNAILGIAPGSIRIPTGPNGEIQPMDTTSPFGTPAQPGGFGIQGSGIDANGDVTRQGTVIMPGVEAKAIGGELLGSLEMPNISFAIKTSAPSATCE